MGIDVHQVASQVCIRTEDGAFIEQRIFTTRAAFAKHLGGRGRARILLEASTESEWVARCLEALGHEVIVADPNFAPMYITKAGHGRLRTLLVEAAWSILRYEHAETPTLRAWALGIAARRGKRIAAVALARKLAGILYAMWRDGSDFGQPARRRSAVAA